MLMFLASLVFTRALAKARNSLFQARFSACKAKISSKLCAEMFSGQIGITVFLSAELLRLSRLFSLFRQTLGSPGVVAR